MGGSGGSLEGGEGIEGGGGVKPPRDEAVQLISIRMLSDISFSHTDGVCVATR